MIFRHLLNMRSHPTWVRGLKPFLHQRKFLNIKSHPTWVRGLKPALMATLGASFRRTLRGCVD